MCARTGYFQWHQETFPAVLAANRTADFITGSRTVCSLHRGTRTGVLVQTIMFTTTNQMVFTALWRERKTKYNLNKWSWDVNKCADYVTFILWSTAASSELREVLLKCSYTPPSAGWVINHTNTLYNNNNSWHQCKQLHTHREKQKKHV